MVRQIQVSDEYYEPYEDDDDPLAVFVAPDYFETDEQLVLIACLMLLEQRYRLMQSMTPSQVLDEIEDIMDSLEVELDNMSYNQAEAHIRKYFNKILSDYNIPDGYVDMDYSMLEIMEDSIIGLINNLRDEIKVKSKFFKDNMSKDNFNLLPNFKRAVRKLIDAVGSNLIHGKEKSKRNVYEFVYGKDKLYRWLTANDDKVCAGIFARRIPEAGKPLCTLCKGDQNNRSCAACRHNSPWSGGIYKRRNNTHLGL
jgi:hypothetical protein